MEDSRTSDLRAPEFSLLNTIMFKSYKLQLRWNILNFRVAYILYIILSVTYGGYFL